MRVGRAGKGNVGIPPLVRRILLALLVLPTAPVEATPVLADLSLETLDPPPEEATVGSDVRYSVVLLVHPLRPPSRIPISASDDAGGTASTEPTEVETVPGTDRYAIEVRWTPARAGPREVRLTAGEAEHVARVAIRHVPAELLLTTGNVTGDWRLPVHAAAAAPLPDRAPAVFEVRWSDGKGGIRWEEAAGDLEVGSEPRVTTFPFALRYGPGRYELILRFDGERAQGTSPALEVEARRTSDPTSEALIVADVPDAPLRLSLRPDPVNEDEKRKRPGEAVLTRVRVEDPNGLAGLNRVTFEVLREGIVRNVTDSSLPPDRWAKVSIDLEFRFAASPLAPGLYEVRVHAWNATGVEASVRRTFLVREVRPDVGEVALGRPDVPTGTDATIEGTLRIASRNWAAPDDVAGLVHVRVYRGTTQVAWPVELGGIRGTAPLTVPATGEWYTSHGERGAETLPIRATIPAGANASFRITVLWSADPTETPTSLGSASLLAWTPPTVTAIAPDGAVLPGGPLGIRIGVDPGARCDNVTVSFLKTSENVTCAGGRATVSLPAGLRAGSTVRISASANAGEVRTTVERDLVVENAPPEGTLAVSVDGLPVERVRLLPGAARSIRIAVATWDANGDDVSVDSIALLDWNGRSTGETSPIAREGGAETVIDLPRDLPPGGYALVVRLRDSAGATSELRRDVLVGGWAAVKLHAVRLAPEGAVLQGDVVLENVGTVPLTALSILVEGDGPLHRAASLRSGSATVAEGAPLPLAVPLAPGGRVTLRVEIPMSTGDEPGSYEGTIKGIAVAEGLAW